MTTTGYTVAIKRNTVYLYVNKNLLCYLFVTTYYVIIYYVNKNFKLKFKTYYLK